MGGAGAFTHTHPYLHVECAEAIGFLVRGYLLQRSFALQEEK